MASNIARKTKAFSKIIKLKFILQQKKLIWKANATAIAIDSLKK